MRFNKENRKNPISFFPSFLLSSDLALISVNGPVEQTDGFSKIDIKFQIDSFMQERFHCHCQALILSQPSHTSNPNSNRAN